MQHIHGISRHQLQVVSLEDTISQDNPVLPKLRDIDAFVHSIDLEKTNFQLSLKPKLLVACVGSRLFSYHNFHHFLFSTMSFELIPFLSITLFCFLILSISLNSEVSRFKIKSLLYSPFAS